MLPWEIQLTALCFRVFWPSLRKTKFEIPCKKAHYHWVFGGAALWWAPQVLTLAVHAGCCFLLMFLVQDTHCWPHNSMATAGRKVKRLSPPATASLDSLEAGPASRPCLGWLRFMTWQDCHLWNQTCNSSGPSSFENKEPRTQLFWLWDGKSVRVLTCSTVFQTSPSQQI